MDRIIHLDKKFLKKKHIKNQKCDSSCTKSKNEAAASTGADKLKLNGQASAGFCLPRK